MVLPELSRTIEQWHIKHAKQFILSCGARTTTGGINLHIEQEKPKLDQITARNIRMSLDKRIAFPK